MDKYGTDALRFTPLTGSAPGNDMNLAIEPVEANRNSLTDLNAARFPISNLNGEH
jgi:valyl-tRNA synthetase